MIEKEISADEACSGTDTEKRFTPVSLVDQLRKDGLTINVGDTSVFATTQPNNDVLGIGAAELFPGINPGSLEHLQHVSAALTADDGLSKAIFELTQKGLIQPVAEGTGILNIGPAVPGITSSIGDGGMVGLSLASRYSPNDITAAVHTPLSFPDGSSNGLLEREKADSRPTNFQLCAEVNNLVGNIPSKSFVDIDGQFRLIEIEFLKLQKSVDFNDQVQLRDDIQNLLFTVYGLAHRMGLPADDDFKAITDSQFSKFDLSEIDALVTRDKYLEMGITTYYDQMYRKGSNLFVTYSAINQTGKDGKSYPAGKWLRSIYYKEPKYKDV